VQTSLNYDAVRGQGSFRTNIPCMEVPERKSSCGLSLKRSNDLLLVPDPSGATELKEVLREELFKFLGVRANFRVQQSLL